MVRVTGSGDGGEDLARGDAADGDASGGFGGGALATLALGGGDVGLDALGLLDPEGDEDACTLACGELRECCHVKPLFYAATFRRRE